MRAAGSRLGKGAGEGLLRGRAGAGDGAGDPTALWARSGRRTSGTPCSSPVARLCVNSMWYSSPVVEFASHLRTTALACEQGKQRSRGWRCGVAGLGDSSTGRRSTAARHRYRLRLSAHGKCSMSCEKRVEKQLLHAFLHVCGGGSGRIGSKSVPTKACGRQLRAPAMLFSSDRSDPLESLIFRFSFFALTSIGPAL